MSLPTMNETELQSAIKEHPVTFVEFVTKWCPPCKALLPILEELQREEKERLSIFKVDCDESPELAAAYGIMSTPTVLVFNNGEPVDKLIGLRPKNVYQAVLGRYQQ